MITRNLEEIENLRTGGRILATVLQELRAMAKPGVSTIELNRFAEKRIKELGAEPSFKNYRTDKFSPRFPASLCVSINHEVVHGMPSQEKILDEGDIAGLDLGVKYKNLFTDGAITVGVGKISKERAKLILAAKEALSNGLAQIKAGARMGDIGFAIESVAKDNKFAIVRQLVGHGVGKAVHEDPEVPGWGKPGTGIKLEEGMVLAVEPMLNAGDWHIHILPDKWTVVTADGSDSAHFEHTVIINKQGCEILTKIN